MTAADPFNLERFVTAQEPVFETVLAELRSGRKRSHWMWFIFPQLAGLGRSSTARFYGISSIDEARAYLAHKLLGPRLELCTRTVIVSESPSLHAIFVTPDDLKFRSCMTLFSRAADDPDNPFRQALDRCCGGQPARRKSGRICRSSPMRWCIAWYSTAGARSGSNSLASLASSAWTRRAR
jgi:uncharacterized protein (DUF1810 family)